MVNIQSFFSSMMPGGGRGRAGDNNNNNNNNEWSRDRSAADASSRQGDGDNAAAGNNDARNNNNNNSTQYNTNNNNIPSIDSLFNGSFLSEFFNPLFFHTNVFTFNNNNNNSNQDIPEEFFQNHPFFQQQRQQPSRVPPASATAIKNLPMVTITKEDLIDPNNRQCCICFNDINLNDKVIRLIPYCGHTFCSRDCIIPWLETNNTCPVCRYELPTDAGYEYERQRQQRMACRKPRLAKYELRRLTISQLKQILLARQHNHATSSKENNERKKSPPHFYDKQDMIDYIISCGDEYVDWIAAPDPVKYSIKELEAMSISQLKNSMNEAGVYFETKKDGILEKSDMLKYFLLSGRLDIIPDDESNINLSNNNDEAKMMMDESSNNNNKKRNSNEFLVETVHEGIDDDDDYDCHENYNVFSRNQTSVCKDNIHNLFPVDEREHKHLVMEEINVSPTPLHGQQQSSYQPMYMDVDERDIVHDQLHHDSGMQQYRFLDNYHANDNNATQELNLLASLNEVDEHESKNEMNTEVDQMNFSTESADSKTMVLSGEDEMIKSDSAVVRSIEDTDFPMVESEPKRSRYASPLAYSETCTENGIQIQNAYTSSQAHNECEVYANSNNTKVEGVQQRTPEVVDFTSMRRIGDAWTCLDGNSEAVQENNIRTDEPDFMGSDLPAAPCLARTGECKIEINEDSFVASNSTASTPCSVKSHSNDDIETDSDIQAGENSIRVISHFQDRSIAELKSMASNLKIDLTGCVERSEIIDSIANAVSCRRNNDNICRDMNDGNSRLKRGHGSDPSILDTFLQHWGEAEIRTLAAVLDIEVSDNSSCTKESMVDDIYEAVATRPYVIEVLTTLEPLARSRTVAQIRAIAREWNINIDDCLEKSEMIKRLITAIVQLD